MSRASNAVSSIPACRRSYAPKPAALIAGASSPASRHPTAGGGPPARLGRAEARPSRPGCRLDQPAARASTAVKPESLSVPSSVCSTFLMRAGAWSRRSSAARAPAARTSSRRDADPGHRVLHRRDRAPRRVRRVARGERAGTRAGTPPPRAGRVKVEARARAVAFGKNDEAELRLDRSSAGEGEPRAPAPPPARRRDRAVRAGGDGARRRAATARGPRSPRATRRTTTAARAARVEARACPSPRAGAPPGLAARLRRPHGDAGGHH